MSRVMILLCTCGVPGVYDKRPDGDICNVVVYLSCSRCLMKQLMVDVYLSCPKCDIAADSKSYDAAVYFPHPKCV